MLNTAPDTLELGLMAYGHRDKGSCTDIETLVAPGPNNKQAVLSAVDGMKFLGKTPLSETVRRAAQELRHTEEKAVVILITDGEETCEADPCAVATELKNSGIDFTAHVVGFGLTQQQGEQVACLAHNTGGQYLEAGNAANLQKALHSTVQTLVAAPQAQPEPEPEPTVEPEALATVQAPERAKAGETIEVHWTGPDATSDYITVVELDAPATEYNEYERTNRGSPVKLQVPDGLGNYEVRYVSQRDKKVLASQALVLEPVTATVELLNAAVPGGKLNVAWTGPNSRADYITIVPKGAPQSHYLDYERTSRGSPITLKAPDEVGEYEIRYVMSISKRVLASLPVTLADAAASLSAPEAVAPGSAIEVEWTGPGNRQDFIEVVEQDAAADAKPLAATRVTQGSPLYVHAPAIPGTYQLRYMMRDTKEVLKSMTFVVR